MKTFNWAALKALAMKVEFDETLHPRDETGKFASGGGSSGGEKPKKERKPRKPRTFRRLDEGDGFSSPENTEKTETIFDSGTPTPTQAEYESLADYMGGNTALINGRPKGRPYRGMSQEDSDKKLAETRKHLDDLIDRSSVPEDIKVFRGISSESLLKDIASGKIKEGSVMTDSGYSSTSLSSDAAEYFAEENGVILHINVPKGSKGLYASKASKKGLVNSTHKPIVTGRERELILPRDQAVKVKSVRPNPDYMKPGIYEYFPEGNPFVPRYIVEAELVKPKKAKAKKSYNWAALKGVDSPKHDRVGDEIELDEEDDAILDKIWDEIGRQKQKDQDQEDQEKSDGKAKKALNYSALKSYFTPRMRAQVKSTKRASSITGRET